MDRNHILKQLKTLKVDELREYIADLIYEGLVLYDDHGNEIDSVAGHLSMIHGISFDTVIDYTIKVRARYKPDMTQPPLDPLTIAVQTALTNIDDHYYDPDGTSCPINGRDVDEVIESFTVTEEVQS